VKSLLVVLLLSMPPATEQEVTGTVLGTVTEAGTGAPLAAANIGVVGTVIGTMSDARGEYRLLNVPAGRREVSFSVVGYAVEIREVDVPEGGMVRLDIELEPTPLPLPDVVITAARSQQRVEEAASSVAVLDAATLRTRAAPRLDAVLSLVPGVTMIDDQLGIRGSTGYNRGAGGRVLVLLDGVPALGGDTGNVRWDTLPAETIQRVEVVKGAASALYGSSAMGGVVNVITRSAHAGPAAYARFRLGTWDEPHYDEYRWRSGGGLTRALEGTLIRALGDLGMMVSGGYEYTDGFRENGWSRYLHGLVKLEGPQGGRDRWNLTATLARQDRGHFIEWRDYNDPYQVSALQRGDWIRSDKIMVTSSWRRLLGRGAYLQLQPHLFTVRWRQYFRDNDDSAVITRAALDAHAVAASSLGTLTLGGMGGTVGVDGSPYGTPTVTEAALYLQDEIEVGPRIRFSAGGRLDLHTTSATATRSVFSPKVALVVTPSPAGTLRLTAGRGFRAPSVAEMFISMATGGFTVIPNPALEPESVWGAEIGGSWSPLPLIRLEASLFRNRYTSMIEGVATGTGEIQFRNVRAARLQGAELSLMAAVPQGWLQGRFTYLWLSARDIGNSEPLAYRRPRRGSGTIEVRGGAWRLATDLIYGAPVSRLGVYPFDRRLPRYRLDARVSRAVGSLRLTLHGHNLTNYAVTEIERNLTAPREWLLSIEWSK